MKKTWFFGMAFTLGITTIPSVSFAQYAPTSYGSGALAPSGYPVSPSLAQPQPHMIPQVGGYAQPVPYESAPQFVQQPQLGQTHLGQPQLGQTQYPQGQFAPSTHVLPQNGQYAQFAQAGAYGQTGVPVQMIAYPQEQLSAPNNSVLQRPEEIWPGEQVGQQPLQQPLLPQPMPVQPGDTSSIPGAPINGSGYGVNPGYAQGLAPTATGGLYGTHLNGAACGGAMAEAPAFDNAGHGSTSWFSNYTGVPGKAWFVGGGALLMRRVDDNNLALAYDTGMPTENVLDTRDARQHYQDGFEVFTGRYFNCGRNALMLNYWGLFPGDAAATIIGGNYRSRLQFNGLETPGQSVYDWYDGAYAQRLIRRSEYHNVEANLLGFAVAGAARTWDSGGCCDGGYGAFTGPCCLTPNVCGSRLNWTWLAGVRWLRFNDELQYSASEFDADFNGSADDLYYDNHVRNDLVGFQLGGVGNYCVGKRLNLYALSKAGIYNNHSELYTRIGTNGGAPDSATINSLNAYNGSDYLVNASQNNAAFLGELGTGMGLRISKGWSANVGYRVIGASGVATAVNTVPIEMLHLGNVAEYNNTSSLLLHGLSIGGMYNF